MQLYANAPFALICLMHFMQQKKRNRCLIIHKKNFTDLGMKIENIKARCAPIVYVQITFSTKTSM